MAGGNAYVSCAKIPASGRPSATDTMNATPYTLLATIPGTKYAIGLPVASPAAACVSAMVRPSAAPNPARACRRSHTNVARANVVAPRTAVVRPTSFHPT